MSCINFIFAGIIAFSGPASAESSTENSPVAKLYSTLDFQYKKLIEVYPDFEKRFKELGSLNRELIPLRSKQTKLMFDKKRDEADYAILNAKVSKLEKELESVAISLFTDFPMPMIALKNSPRSGKKADEFAISKKIVTDAVDSYKKSGLGMGMLKLECFEEDGSIRLEKKCVQEAMAFCSRELTNEGTILAKKSLSDNLELIDQKFETLDEYVSFKSSQFKDDKSGEAFKDLFDKLVKAEFYTCSSLAKQGITFRSKNIRFKENPPEWVSNLSYKSVWASEELVNDKCLGKSGVPKEVRSRFGRLKVDFRIEYPINGIEKGLQQCASAISALCSASYVLKEKLVLTYPTQSCEVREVTAEDIEADLQRWKYQGSSEAELLAHSTILDTIRTCEAAREYGYDWRYIAPKAGPKCKGKQKK